MLCTPGDSVELRLQWHLNVGYFQCEHTMWIYILFIVLIILKFWHSDDNMSWLRWCTIDSPESRLNNFICLVASWGLSCQWCFVLLIHVSHLHTLIYRIITLILIVNPPLHILYMENNLRSWCYSWVTSKSPSNNCLLCFLGEKWIVGVYCLLHTLKRVFWNLQCQMHCLKVLPPQLKSLTHSKGRSTGMDWLNYSLCFPYVVQLETLPLILTCVFSLKKTICEAFFYLVCVFKKKMSTFVYCWCLLSGSVGWTCLSVAIFRARFFLLCS